MSAAAFRGPPDVDPTAWVHPTASLCGTVTIGPRVSVWGGSVLRGDTDQLTIGAGSNIQELSVVHTDVGLPLHVGDGVTVGHRAILHGCHVDDGVLVGMGAILMNRCRIGTGSIIGAGALVSEGVVIPPNSLVLGVPGKVVRQTTEAERARIAASALHYQQQAAAHRDGVVRYHPPS